MKFHLSMELGYGGRVTQRKAHTRPTVVLDEYVQSLLKANVIEPSQRGPFVASIFAIPKNNGEARLIIDYSNVTPLLRPPKYYLPSIYQIVSRKRFPFREPFFIKIDLRNAFYNIPIHPKLRFVTTFWYFNK